MSAWGVTEVWGEHRDQDWREMAGQVDANFRVGRGITDPGAKTIRAANAREARERFARIRGIRFAETEIVPMKVRSRSARYRSPSLRQRSHRHGYCGQ